MEDKQDKNGHAVCVFRENNLLKVFDNDKILIMPEHYTNISQVVTEYYKLERSDMIVNID